MEPTAIGAIQQKLRSAAVTIDRWLRIAHHDLSPRLFVARFLAGLRWLISFRNQTMRFLCRVCGWKSIHLPLAVLFTLGWVVSDSFADEPAFRAYDGFDGKSSLEWDPVRPDPTHVSLEKNPGKFTITTQRGSIHGDEKKDTHGAGIQAKNLYLIHNPAGGDGDFVATTCIEAFSPETHWQQAGLMVYDDDNYLKWDLEWNQDSPAGVTIVFLQQTAQRSQISATTPEADSKRFWLRLAKRADAYQLDEFKTPPRNLSRTKRLHHPTHRLGNPLRPPTPHAGRHRQRERSFLRMGR